MHFLTGIHDNAFNIVGIFDVTGSEYDICFVEGHTRSTPEGNGPQEMVYLSGGRRDLQHTVKFAYIKPFVLWERMQR